MSRPPTPDTWSPRPYRSWWYQRIDKDKQQRAYEYRVAGRHERIAEAATGPKPWQSLMSGPEYAPTFSGFLHLPVELQCYIIQLAVRGAIGDYCTEGIGHLNDTYHRSHCDCQPLHDSTRGCANAEKLQNREVEVLGRRNLMRGNCLGGLLATNRQVRGETIAWLERYRVSGLPWESSGQEVPRIGYEREGYWKVLDMEAISGMGVLEWGFWRKKMKRRNVRREVKRWMATVYSFKRVYTRWLREGDMPFFEDRNGFRSARQKKWMSVKILD